MIGIAVHGCRASTRKQLIPGENLNRQGRPWNVLHSAQPGEGQEHFIERPSAREKIRLKMVEVLPRILLLVDPEKYLAGQSRLIYFELLFAPALSNAQPSPPLQTDTTIF